MSADAVRESEGKPFDSCLTLEACGSRKPFSLNAFYLYNYFYAMHTLEEGEEGMVYPVRRLSSKA